MNNKLIMSVVGIAICVILVGSVLAPVVEDAQYTIVTSEQNTTERYVMANNAGDDTITVTHKSAGVWTVNDSDFTIPSSYFTVGLSNDAVLRLGNSTILVLQSESPRVELVSISYTEGVATCVTAGGETVTYDWDFLIFPSNEGGWGCFEHIPSINEPVHINNDVTAYLVENITWNNSTNTEIFSLFEFKNGEITKTHVPLNVATSWNGVFTAYPDAEVTLEYTEDDDGITKTYTQGTAIAGGITYDAQSYIIAPLEYKTHGPSEVAALDLISILPLLVIVAILVSAITLIRVKD